MNFQVRFWEIPVELTIGGIAVRTERAKANKARVKEEDDEDWRRISATNSLESCLDLICWLFHSPLRKTGVWGWGWARRTELPRHFFFSVLLCGPFLDRWTGLLEYGPIGFCWGFGPFGDLQLLLDKQARLHANFILEHSQNLFFVQLATNLDLKPKN